jgi:hypothetical protein
LNSDGPDAALSAGTGEAGFGNQDFSKPSGKATGLHEERSMLVERSIEPGFPNGFAGWAGQQYRP